MAIHTVDGSAAVLTWDKSGLSDREAWDVVAGEEGGEGRAPEWMKRCMPGNVKFGVIFGISGLVMMAAMTDFFLGKRRGNRFVIKLT